LLLNFRNFLRQTLLSHNLDCVCLEPSNLLSATFAPFWASVCTQASFQAALHLSSSLKLLLSTDLRSPCLLVTTNMAFPPCRCPI
jgi:hypothetical protein